MNAAGELELALSEGGPLVVGNVKGEPGQNGVSVTGASLNTAGELELALSEEDHSLLAM